MGKGKEDYGPSEKPDYTLMPCSLHRFLLNVPLGFLQVVILAETLLLWVNCPLTGKVLQAGPGLEK